MTASASGSSTPSCSGQPSCRSPKGTNGSKATTKTNATNFSRISRQSADRASSFARFKTPPIDARLAGFKNRKAMAFKVQKVVVVTKSNTVALIERLSSSWQPVKRP